jgi:hypothetical protein
MTKYTFFVMIIFASVFFWFFAANVKMIKAATAAEPLAFSPLHTLWLFSRHRDRG